MNILIILFLEIAVLLSVIFYPGFETTFIGENTGKVFNYMTFYIRLWWYRLKWFVYKTIHGWLSIFPGVAATIPVVGDYPEKFVVPS